MSLSLESIRALPKVALHEHLDGGPRPGTLVELAAEVGHALPAADPEELGAWFVAAASSGSLERFLTTFDNVLPMMQRAEHLRRIAREAVVDLADDGAPRPRPNRSPPRQPSLRRIPSRAPSPSSNPCPPWRVSRPRHRLRRPRRRLRARLPNPRPRPSRRPSGSRSLSPNWSQP